MKFNIYHALTVIYLVGLAGHAIPLIKPYMISITPWTLLFTGLLVLYPEIRRKNIRLAAWVLVIGIITHLIEAIGVSTGRIFGFYRYGTPLGAAVFDVPLIIAFNWVMVLYTSIAAASYMAKKTLTVAAMAASLLVVLDFCVEPVAIALGYWQWQSGIIPFRNYCAWWIISLIMAFLYGIMDIERDRRLPAYYYLVMLVYFIIFNVVLIIKGSGFPYISKQ